MHLKTTVFIGGMHLVLVLMALTVAHGMHELVRRSNEQVVCG